jgi:hypothetical protein
MLLVNQTEGLEMKTRGVVVILFLVAFAFAPANVNAENTYAARLISPTAGQVLYPGQTVRVEWRAQFPHVPRFDRCEMELYLSLDGGRTYLPRITPSLDPKTTYFYWTVPNLPTNEAVLDIRFGCEMWYPESYSPQTASTFVIRQADGEFY